MSNSDTSAAETNPQVPLRLFQPAATPEAEKHLRRADFCRTFEEATGWLLRFVPVAPGGSDAQGEAPWSAPIEWDGERGTLRLELASRAARADRPRNRQPADLHAAVELAEAYAALINDLSRAQVALAECEAELAAGVPLTPHPREREQLAARLQGVLRAAAEAVDCRASGLYVLSDDTAELKLRAVHGLPTERLTAPARPLPNCLADLEAMSGHAVTIANTAEAPYWRPPEDCAAAACVPVASSTQILGTLWVFSKRVREFSDVEVNVLELAAGRLAVELERAMLMGEVHRLAEAKQLMQAARAYQQDELPKVLPPLEGWDLAAWAQCAGDVGGALFDWLPLDNGELAVVAIHASRGGIQGALLSASLRALLRAHAEFTHFPGELLARVNRSLWASSPGDKQAQALVAVLRPQSGVVRYATAGAPWLLARSGFQWTARAHAEPALGVAAQASYATHALALEQGDALLLLADGAPAPANDPVPAALQERLQAAPRSAVELAERLRGASCRASALADQTAMALLCR